jgi:hypothetical protein
MAAKDASGTYRERWGDFEYAQDGIQNIYPNGLPERVNISKLAAAVSVDVKKRHPEWAAKHVTNADGLLIDRKIVERALQTLHRILGKI